MDTGGINIGQLRSIVERIENLDDEITNLNADKAEIYRESKGNGFDNKILKKLIARRRKNAAERDEEDTMLELYERAIEAPIPRARHAHEDGPSPPEPMTH